MPTNETIQESGFINPSVDALKGRISSSGGGLLRPYDYKVNVPFLNINENREINDILQDVTLPSKTHATQPVYYGGPLQNVPYITTYPGTITLTMLCTEESSVRDKFYRWLDTVIYSKSGLVNYRDRYARDNMTIEVTKNAKYKAEVATNVSVPGIGSVPFFVPNEGLKYTLFDVFPDSINEIPLSQNSQNDYLRISVVMMYRKWIKGIGINENLGRNDPDSQGLRRGLPSNNLNNI